jgi:hypothetical protein
VRLVDWYLALGLGQKIVVGLAVAVVLFLASYFATLALLSSSMPEDDRSPQAGTTGPAAAPGVTFPEASSATPRPFPDVGVQISSARWQGEKAVVKGTWKGDISSMHCDLLEGGSEGSATDWWDRGVSAKMSWGARTFSQNFVEAEGRKIEDPIDAASSYSVLCSAHFSGGWSTGDEAPIEGAPPGEG